MKFKFIVLFLFNIIGQVKAQNEIIFADVQPHVVSSNEEFHFYIELELENIDSIELIDIGIGSYKRKSGNLGYFNSRDTLLFQNNIKVASLILKDDGKGKDKIQGDNIFSTSNLKWDWARNQDNQDTYTTGFSQLRTLFYSNGEIVGGKGAKINYGITLNYVRDLERLSELKVKNLNDNLQYSEYVINVSENYDWSVHPREFTNKRIGTLNKLFREYFKNDNAELVFAFAYSQQGANSIGHINLKNDVENICLDIFSTSSLYPILPTEGFTWGAPTMVESGFVHEYLHRYYAGGCPPLGQGNHFGLLDFNNSGFFPPIWDFQSYGSDTVSAAYYQDETLRSTRKYNFLELYLLGLAEIEEIEWPIKYIKNGRFLTTDRSIIPNRKLYLGSIDSIRLSDFLELTGGIRSPTFEPDTLYTSCIVFSKGLLTPKELLYFDIQARKAEIKSENHELTNIFYATNGKLFHRTKLRSINDITSITDLKRKDFSIKIFPNPVNTNLTIQNDRNLDLNYSIFDVYGKQIQTGKSIRKSQHSVDVSNIPDGVYLVHFENNKGIHVEKIIIN